MTRKKLLTSSEEGSEYTQQVWRESIKDLLRYDKTFCLVALLPISIGCTGQFQKSKIILIVCVRMALTIYSLTTGS